MIYERPGKKFFFIYSIMILVIFALSSAILMASDLSETYKDRVRFELRLASMEKVDGWKSVASPGSAYWKNLRIE